jgi:tetratricopeptide (TPR) repeat protein
MKVYIHYEGVCGAPITIATTITNETSSQLILSLTEKYYRKFQIKLDPSCLYLSFQDNNKKICLYGNEIISQIVCDKDDIFIIDCKSRETNKSEIPTKSNNTTTASSTTATPNTKSVSKPIEKVIVEKKKDNVKSNELVTRLKQIKSQFDQKMFRQARKLCEDALKTISSNDKDLLVQQIEIAIVTNVFDVAIATATKVSKLYPTESYNHYLLGKALCAGERFDEAELALEKSLSLHKSSSSSTKKSKTALENQMFELDIVACQAECLFASGSHVEAADLINARVGRPGTEKHIPILVAYATFAMKYDKIEESMRALLNAIVLDQKNKKTRAVLSKLLQTEKGYQQLTLQLPPNEQAAVAYAFIAIIAKESGAIESCCKLLTQALKIKPTVANYALNLAHAFEIVHDYASSIKAIVHFCKFNESLRIGVSGFSCKDILDVLPDDIKSNGYPVSTSPTHSVTWIEEEGEKGICIVNLIADTDEVDGVVNGGKSYEEKLSDNDLDLLALAFTMVKILYLQGRISVLPLLYEVIESTRIMSTVSCHETTIRNEYAYYQSIAQILSTRTQTHPVLSVPEVAFSDPLTSTIPALITLRKETPIYICGDSHALSPSWNVLRIEGKERIIIPKLVTGKYIIFY